MVGSIIEPQLLYVIISLPAIAPPSGSAGVHCAHQTSGQILLPRAESADVQAASHGRRAGEVLPVCRLLQGRGRQGRQAARILAGNLGLLLQVGLSVGFQQVSMFLLLPSV